MARLELTIKGMSCNHCVRGVTQALSAVPGVEVEQVAVGSATIAYDPAAVTLEQLNTALAQQGYEVTGNERLS
jgi:copper chaperone CopZ